jgi:hypothetical protein
MLGFQKVSQFYLYLPIYRYTLKVGESSRREDIFLDVCELAWQAYKYSSDVGLCV